MFGSSTPSSGGFFGANNNNTANQSGSLFGKPATPSTGSFGANNAQNNNTGGGLFGSANNASSGNNGTTGGQFGGLFGTGNNNQNQNQNSNATGGLFGGNSTGFSGGLSGGGTRETTPVDNFSNANQLGNTTSTGLFGNSLNNQNQTINSTGGSLFGGNNAAGNDNKTIAPSGGLFGSNNSSNATGGLFGAKSNTTNTASTGSLFGANNGSNTSSGLFGAKTNSMPTNGAFGSNTNNTTNSAGGLFGSNNGTNNNSSTGFSSANSQNASTSSQPSFGWTSSQPTNQQQSTTFQESSISKPLLSNPLTNNSNYTPNISDQLLKIKEQWDPNSSKCLLKTHFYNKVNENDLFSYQRPNNETPEDWEGAMSNRPDKSSVPVKVAGFDDVAKRVNTQIEHVKNSRIILTTISEKQKHLGNKHDLDTATRIIHAKTKHVKLSRRLLRLATLLAIIKLKGYPLLPEEEELSKEFENLNGKLVSPTGLGRINEIFARISILKDRSLNISNNHNNSLRALSVNSNYNKEDHGIVSDESEEKNLEMIDKISKILLKQQIGLTYLNDIIEKDLQQLKELTENKI